MKTIFSIACLPCLFLAACGSGSGPSRSSGQGFKPLSQRIDEKNGYEVDASGNWVPRNNKRSSFESKGQAAGYSGEYSKKEFGSQEYARKSWWGNKDYGRKGYDGNTDGGRFRKPSRLDGQGARETGSQADVPGAYQTDAYATSAAREAAGKKLVKPVDANTSNRRESFDPPEVVDWRKQRSLSVEESKGLLGR